MVHLNKPFFVNGETIWYLLYLPKSMAGTRATLKVIIRDGEGQVQNDYFLATEGQTSISGYYKLPYNASAGMYQILIWGRALNSLREAIFAAVPIPVYNDLEPLPPKQPIVSVQNLDLPKPPTDLSSDLPLKVNVQPATPNAGQEVTVSVRVLDANGLPVPQAEVSISVTDAKLVGSSVLPASSLLRGYPLPKTRWENGFFLRGMVVPEQDTFPDNLILAGYLPLSRRFYYSRVDDNGNAVLQFPSFYTLQHIPLLTFPERGFTWTSAAPLRTPALPSLPYTRGVLDYLNKSRQRKIIYQLYMAVEQSMTTADLISPFTWPEADRRIIPKDYAEFPDLKTLFAEVVTPLRLVEEADHRFRATMRNTANRERFPEPPIFILDGQVTRDAAAVAQLQPAEIAFIDLYHDGDRVFQEFLYLADCGLVVIQSKSKRKDMEEAQVEARLPGLQQPATFAEPIIPEAAPDLRPVQYWSGRLLTDERGMAKGRYHQSDDRSRFLIDVVVQRPSGKRQHRQLYYSLLDSGDR